MEQQDRASTSFKKMVQKAVNAKTKAGLRCSTMVWNLDIRYPRGHHSSYNTSSKVQFQGSNNKDSFYSKEPKPKDLKLAPSRDETAAKLAKKKDKKDKKKKFRE